MSFVAAGTLSRPSNGGYGKRDNSVVYSPCSIPTGRIMRILRPLIVLTALLTTGARYDRLPT
jgi:hypothetical protein